MDDAPFRVEVCRGEHALDVTVAGELDSVSAPRLDDAIASGLDACDEPEVNLSFDLSGVTYIDSAGLRVLIGAMRKVKDAQGKISVSACSGPVRRVFEIVGVDRAIGVDLTAKEG